MRRAFLVGSASALGGDFPLSCRVHRCEAAAAGIAALLVAGLAAGLVTCRNLTSACVVVTLF
jgi:hypothetical protein